MAADAPPPPVPGPRLLCAGGMHGNGHYALRSLLDGHPQVVAFPFFLANLFRSWRWSSLSSASWPEALRRAIPLVTDDPVFHAHIGITREEVGFDDEGFRRHLLDPDFLRAREGRAVRLEELIHHLVDSYRRTLRRYDGAEVVWYAFEVDSREYPWDDPYFRTHVTHLFSMRDWRRSYLGHRAEILERHHWSMPRFLFTKAPLEMSQLLRNWRVFRECARTTDLVVFPFEEMRADPTGTMTRIAGRLGIRYDPCLEELTRNGVPEAGYTADGHRASNRLHRTGGAYLFPAGESELLLTNRARPVDPATLEPLAVEPPRAGSILRAALRDAFRGLPREALTSRMRFEVPGDAAGPLAGVAGRRFPDRRTFVDALRAAGAKSTDVAAALAACGRISRLHAGFLRCATFAGLVHLWVLTSVFGPRLRTWPHLWLLVRLGVYHRLEAIYKRRAFRRG